MSISATNCWSQTSSKVLWWRRQNYLYLEQLRFSKISGFQRHMTRLYIFYLNDLHHDSSGAHSPDWLSSQSSAKMDRKRGFTRTCFGPWASTRPPEKGRVQVNETSIVVDQRGFELIPFNFEDSFRLNSVISVISWVPFYRDWITNILSRDKHKKPKPIQSSLN